MSYQIRRRSRGNVWENVDDDMSSEIEVARQQGRALVLVEDQVSGERFVVVRDWLSF